MLIWRRDERRVLDITRSISMRRRLERERGPMRFEFYSSDPHAIATLMRWKFDRYRTRGYFDIYAEPWIRQLLDRIHAKLTPQFGGVLSLLFAGGELAAGHFGLRSRSLLHHWFPAYNPNFATYSPGMILMLEIAKHAPVAGVRQIELGGFDDYPYKRRLMTHSIELAEGVAHVNPAVVAVQRARVRAEQWVRRSPRLHPVARALRRHFDAIRLRLGSAAG